MSVIDRFEREPVGRLRELRSLAIEYQRLEHVARRLGLSLDDGHTPAPRKRTPSRKPASTQRRPATAVSSPPTTTAGGALGRAPAASKPKRPRRTSSSSSDSGRADGQRPSRRQDVLHLIQDRPGITVKEIVTELHVGATNLYRHVRKLQEDGAVTKHGTALLPNSQ